MSVNVTRSGGITRRELLAALGTAATASVATESAAAAEESDMTGYTLVGVQGSIQRYPAPGRVALYDDEDELVWTEDSADHYFDVTWLDDGRVLACFADKGSDTCGEYESPCGRTGFRIIDPGPADDPEPTIVEEYSFPVRTMAVSEVHDVEPLGSGVFLLTDMDKERIFTVEKRDGEWTETWEWRAADHYDAPKDPTKVDWLHINDVDVIEEDRYLVSVRNANQLVVVTRGEGVTEVINEDGNDGNDDHCRTGGIGQVQLRDTDGDGDTHCGDPAIINRQHNPQWLGEGAVLVADSHNNRVIELHRNGGKWEGVWGYGMGTDERLNWPRDADRLPNGNTLITDTRNRRVIEVTPDREIVNSIEMDRIYVPYEADRLPHGEQVGAPTIDPERSAGGLSGVIARNTPLSPPQVGIGIITGLLGLLAVAIRFRRRLLAPLTSEPESLMVEEIVENDRPDEGDATADTDGRNEGNESEGSDGGGTTDTDGVPRDGPGMQAETQSTDSTMASEGGRGSPDTAANVVYAAWYDLASTVGIDDPRSATPGEVVAAAEGTVDDETAVEELREVFEAVRYGGTDPASAADRATELRDRALGDDATVESDEIG